MNRGLKCCLWLSVAILLLFVMNLLAGSVNIPVGDIIGILSGDETVKESWRYIVLESRLPHAITAVCCGSSLAVSGLLLQTAFNNPLAGPGIFGISSGAGLGVALVMLMFGGSLSTGILSFSGFAAVLVAAFVGAMAVTVLIFFLSTLVSNYVMLLIAGIMVGYMASSAISLLNFFATEEGVRSYVMWGMGSFHAVSPTFLPLFAGTTMLGLSSSMLLVKPLNGLLLGERYAENLGVNVGRTRNWLLIETGLLTAVTTAFCGPIAFIGLAVPHMARLILKSDNHRQLMPTTLLCGAVVALLCNWICVLPGEHGILPLNAVTPLIGAPIVIYVLLRQRI